MTPIIHGLAARALADRVTLNFTVGGLTKDRGWWPEDVEGEVARYHHACVFMFEPARAILGVPMIEDSGARPIGHNENGRASSMHLPPIQRLALRFRYWKRPPAERGAALDFRPKGMPCDEAFWRLDAAQRDGRLPPGGLFWYRATKAKPGPLTGRFLHIDDRGELARERDKIPGMGRP